MFLQFCSFELFLVFFSSSFSFQKLQFWCLAIKPPIGAQGVKVGHGFPKERPNDSKGCGLFLNI